MYKSTHCADFALLLDLGHLLATANLGVRHSTGARTALDVNQLGFTRVANITITGFSRHLLDLLFGSGCCGAKSDPTHAYSQKEILTTLR